MGYAFLAVSSKPRSSKIGSEHFPWTPAGRGVRVRLGHLQTVPAYPDGTIVYPWRPTFLTGIEIFSFTCTFLNGVPEENISI